MRPLSGSGSFGLLSALVEEHGADSLFAKIGATMFWFYRKQLFIFSLFILVLWELKRLVILSLLV